MDGAIKLVFPKPPTQGNKDAVAFISLHYLEKQANRYLPRNGPSIIWKALAQLIELKKSQFSLEIQGVSQLAMEQIRGSILQCGKIDNLLPTSHVEDFGRWTVTCKRPDREAVSQWLGRNLPNLISPLPDNIKTCSKCDAKDVGVRTTVHSHRRLHEARVQDYWAQQSRAGQTSTTSSKPSRGNGPTPPRFSANSNDFPSLSPNSGRATPNELEAVKHVASKAVATAVTNKTAIHAVNATVDTLTSQIAATQTQLSDTLAIVNKQAATIAALQAFCQDQGEQIKILTSDLTATKQRMTLLEGSINEVTNNNLTLHTTYDKIHAQFCQQMSADGVSMQDVARINHTLQTHGEGIVKLTESSGPETIDRLTSLVGNLLATVKELTNRVMNPEEEEEEPPTTTDIPDAPSPLTTSPFPPASQNPPADQPSTTTDIRDASSPTSTVLRQRGRSKRAHSRVSRDEP